MTREILVIDGKSVTTSYTSGAHRVHDVNRVAGAVAKVGGGGTLGNIDLIWLDEDEAVAVTETNVGATFDEPVKGSKVKLLVHATGTITIDGILIGSDYVS